ncbi:hypothetical protein A6R68_02938 [Neotoma lepida]|uniref:Uncharacterized protein n=1 Tax=Neotoma lepida TaxID=56216 RepID=A0A1A6GT64_NEOLE|nr:hypothetical protein A6R68_02938 [Neotoma lepida]
MDLRPKSQLYLSSAFSCSGPGHCSAPAQGLSILLERKTWSPLLSSLPASSSNKDASGAWDTRKRDKVRGKEQAESRQKPELPGQAQLGVGTHKRVTETKGRLSLAESAPGYSSASCSPGQTRWAEYSLVARESVQPPTRDLTMSYQLAHPYLPLPTQQLLLGVNPNLCFACIFSIEAFLSLLWVDHLLASLRGQLSQLLSTLLGNFSAWPATNQAKLAVGPAHPSLAERSLAPTVEGVCPSAQNSILPGDCKVSSDTVHVFQELLMMPSKGIEAKVMAIDGLLRQRIPRLHSRSCPEHWVPLVTPAPKDCSTSLKFSTPYKTSFTLSYYFLFPISPEISVCIVGASQAKHRPTGARLHREASSCSRRLTAAVMLSCDVTLQLDYIQSTELKLSDNKRNKDGTNKPSNAKRHFYKIPKLTTHTQVPRFQTLSSVTYCVSERQQKSRRCPWGSKGRDIDTEDRLVIKAWKNHDVPGNSRAENLVCLLMMQRGTGGELFRHGGPTSCRPSCFSSPKPILPGTHMSTNICMPSLVTARPPEVLPAWSLTMPHPVPAGTDFWVAAYPSTLAPYQCQKCLLLCATAKSREPAFIQLMRTQEFGHPQESSSVKSLPPPHNHLCDPFLGLILASAATDTF